MEDGGCDLLFLRTKGGALVSVLNMLPIIIHNKGGDFLAEKGSIFDPVRGLIVSIFAPVS